MRFSLQTLLVALTILVVGIGVATQYSVYLVISAVFLAGSTLVFDAHHRAVRIADKLLLVVSGLVLMLLGFFAAAFYLAPVVH